MENTKGLIVKSAPYFLMSRTAVNRKHMTLVIQKNLESV